MGSKFLSFTLTIIIILLIICMTILGINIYKDLTGTKVEVGSYEYVPDASNVELKNILETPKVVINPLDNIESTLAPTEVEYSDSSSTKNYFYEQLNEYSKLIYNGIENNKTNMVTGIYKIEFGSKFSDLLKNEGGEKLLQDYYQSAIEAFTYDNPDIFYLDPTKMYLNIQTITRGDNVTYNVYLDNGEEQSYLAKGFNSPEDVQNTIAQIEQIKDDILNNLQGVTISKKIQAIHDYLVENIEYDQTISKDNIYNICGAILNKESVCEGYAKAFKYLTNEAGINCVIVIGTASNSKGETEDHAWNYVELDGKWYAVDCTWDDPIIVGNGKLTDKSKYKYFLKGASTMNIDHFPSGQFTTGGKEFEYPNLET